MPIKHDEEKGLGYDGFYSIRWMGKHPPSAISAEPDCFVACPSTLFIHAGKMPRAPLPSMAPTPSSPLLPAAAEDDEEVEVEDVVSPLNCWAATASWAWEWLWQGCW